MTHIRVEVVINEAEGFTSLIFAPRDNDEAHRNELDLIMRCILDPELKRRGGVILGGLRVDVNLPPSEARPLLTP